MKLAVFYENIKDGLAPAGLTMEEALRRLKASGITRIYANARGLSTEWEELEPVLRRLEVEVEGLYDFCDFAKTAPKELPPGADYRELIDTAVRVGAAHVLVVPGFLSMNPETRDAELKLLIAGVAEAAAYGEKKGIQVSMEDFDGMPAPYCTIDGLNAFMQAVPGLYCSFDTGNFIMYHEDEYEAFRLFESRLCTIHLKDRSEEATFPGDKWKSCADGKKIFCAPVGSGTMQIERIMDEALAHGYTGNVIIELYDCDPAHMLEAAEQSADWLRQRYPIG